MNIPFRFASASAGDVKQLYSTTDNLVLSALNALSLLPAFDLNTPATKSAWLAGYSVGGDGAAVVAFGVYDPDSATFYEVAPVTVPANNTVERRMAFGPYLPIGGRVVPALKILSGSGVVLTGDAELIVNSAENDVALANDGTPVGLLLSLTRGNG